MVARIRTTDLAIEGAADPDMTVLSFDEEAQNVRARDSEFYKLAELRERIVLGDEIEGTSPTLIGNVPLGGGVDLRMPMHENVILPALQTLVARLDQGRIDAKCWPRTPTPARIAAAEGGNLILDSERAREKRDMKVHEALLWALIHGDSGVYTTWDESYGPVESIEQVMAPDGMPVFDPATGLPQTQLVEEYGATRVEVLTTFKFWTSGEDDPEETRWQVRRRIVDKWTARKLLHGAGIDRDVDDKPMRGRRGRSRRGVEVREIWVKPGAMIEPGLFALVVDDCAVKSMPYPYEHGRLPISVLTCMRVDDTPHGHTVTKDGIYQQKLVDIALRSILRLADIAGMAYGIATSDIVAAIDEAKEGFIADDDARDASSKVHWWTGAEAVATGMQALGGVMQGALDGVNRVIGVSEESVSGGDPTSTSSGEQLKTASALDSQKTVPMRRRAEEQWAEVDRQKIELVRQKASKPRLWSLAGDPVRAAYLEGADLDGVDVMIMPASGLALSPEGKARAAEEGAAAGFIDPAQAGEMRQTGLTSTVLDQEQRQRIEKQGWDAIRGSPQQPLPGIPGAAAARLLRMIQSQAPPGRSMLLMRLIAAYDMMATPQANPAAAQAAGSAQGAPGKPKVTETTKQAGRSALPPPEATQ